MSRKILLVDDDENTVNALADLMEFSASVQCLRLQGMKDVIAHGVEILAQNPDGTPGLELAILDINLGADEPSGVDVYQWLIGHGFGGKIVFLTGHAKNHPLVREAHEIRGAAVYEKPLGIEKLLSWVGAK